MSTEHAATRETFNGPQYRQGTGKPHEAREGKLTRSIEQVTSTIPSGLFLSLSVASMATSATLKLLGRDTDALFVGQWAPTLLILGLYNKLVKIADSQ